MLPTPKASLQPLQRLATGVRQHSEVLQCNMLFAAQQHKAQALQRWYSFTGTQQTYRESKGRCGAPSLCQGFGKALLCVPQCLG